MPRPKTSQEFRDAVKRAFDTVSRRLKDDRKVPAREISDLLNVSRQTAYQYLNGTAIPGPDRLATVIRTWDLELEFRGHRFDQRAFGPGQSRPEREPLQIPLDLDDLSKRPAEIELPGTGTWLRIGFEDSVLKLSFKLKRTA